MKLSTLGSGLLVGMLALAQAGCHQAEKAKTTDYIPKKPEDPTAWTDADVTRGSSDSGDKGLPKAANPRGTWSSQAQDIEKSLGVTQ